MTTAIERIANPFSTRWVRPGALPYFFPPSVDAAVLVDRLKENERWGAIVGPHGSGKSTLLTALIPVIEKTDIEIRHVQLRADDRRLKIASNSLPKNGLLVIDGFEQLSWWHRRRVLRTTRNADCGLLVTAHDERTAGRIPVIFRTIGDLNTLQHIVDRHLPACGDSIMPADVAFAFRAHGGNIRDTLFALYDVFEQRRNVPNRNRSARSPDHL